MNSEILDALPKIAPATDLTLGRSQALIASCGFEDRSLSFKQTITGCCADSAAILLDYRPVNTRNQVASVKEAVRGIGISRQRIAMVPFDRYTPRDYPHLLRTSLRELAVSSVVLDISSMSKLAIILSLKIFLEEELDVLVHYAEASQYSPTRAEFEEAQRQGRLHQPTVQVYCGFHSLVHHRLLASVAMQGQPIGVVAFMSLNDLLVQSLLDSFYPARLFLVNGRPPVLSWREDATAWIHEQIRSEWPQDNPQERHDDRWQVARATSTLDYRETVDLLLSSIYWALADSYRLVLAPTGSKMQALGCFFLHALHPDVHIEYPTPKTFWKGYSRGVGKRWLVDLGNIESLSTRLREIDTAIHLLI